MQSRVSEYRPSDISGRYISLFWEGIFNEGRQQLLTQQVVPNGFVEVIIHLSGVHCELLTAGRWKRSPLHSIIGLHAASYPVRFPENVHVFGIRFRPEGLYSLSGIKPAAITDTFDDAGAFTGSHFRDLCDRLLYCTDFSDRVEMAEDYFKTVAKRDEYRQEYLFRAAEAIRQSAGCISLDRVAAAACISPRQLQRAFRQILGISPGQLARIARHQEAHRRLQQLPMPNLTMLSYDCGYADQAHFIREFRQFTGSVPRAFTRERNRYLVNAR